MADQPSWIKILEIVTPILAFLIVIYDIMRRLRRRRGEPPQEPAAAEQSPQNPVELPAQNQNPSAQRQASAGPNESSRTILRGENGEEAESGDHHPQGLHSVTSEVELEILAHNPPTQQEASVGVEGAPL